MKYRFVVKDIDNGFEIILYNETKMKAEYNFRFKLSDGYFERVF